MQRLLKLQKLPPREEMQEIVDRMWMQVVSGNLEVYRNQGHKKGQTGTFIAIGQMETKVTRCSWGSNLKEE